MPASPAARAALDPNRKPSLLAVSNVDFVTLVALAADPTTGALAVDVTLDATNINAKITDGTNTANVGSSTDTNENFLLTGGAIQTDTFSTTSSGNGTSYLVSGFASVSVDVKTQLSGGSVNFQVSNDNTNWRPIALIRTDIGGFSISSQGNGQMWSGNLQGAKYFSINNTGSGGTAAGTIVFSTVPIVPPIIGASLNSNGSTGVAFGSPSNSDGNTANFSTLMVDTFPQLFNGTTWDRWKSTTTGIAGVNINDGTNSANILKSDGTAAGQNAQIVAGGGMTTATITLNSGTPNTNWYDMLNYAWVSVEILTNTTPATLTFQTSGDSSQTNVRSMAMVDTNNAAASPVSTTTSAAATFVAPRNGRYFRISSNNGAGTTTLVITFFTVPSANIGMQYVTSGNSTGSAVPANAFYIAGISSGNLTGVQVATPSDSYPNTVNNLGVWGLQATYNGSTWDRQRGNLNTTTGDSPTITTATTTNGATQTNYNAAGAYITVLLGAVSGASPSLAIQLQYSPDGGTTWLNFGPASTALAVASNNTLAIAVYPTALTASLLGTTTTTDNAQINAHLPRTWRLQFISTGTITSIAVTSVQVNYLL